MQTKDADPGASEKRALAIRAARVNRCREIADIALADVAVDARGPFVAEWTSTGWRVRLVASHYRRVAISCVMPHAAPRSTMLLARVLAEVGRMADEMAADEVDYGGTVAEYQAALAAEWNGR